MHPIKIKKGFTVIEAAITTSFIAAAVAVVFIVYPKIDTERKVEAEAKALTVFSSNVEAIFRGTPDYTGLNVSSAIAGRMVPSSMVNGTTLRSVFGGNVIVRSGSASGGPVQDIFFVQYYDLNPDQCIRLISKVQGNFDAVFAGVDSATPNSEAVFNKNPVNPAYSRIPYSVGNTVARCNANQVNIVTFYHV